MQRCSFPAILLRVGGGERESSVVSIRGRFCGSERGIDKHVYHVSGRVSIEHLPAVTIVIESSTGDGSDPGGRSVIYADGAFEKSSSLRVQIGLQCGPAE